MLSSREFYPLWRKLSGSSFAEQIIHSCPHVIHKACDLDQIVYDGADNFTDVKRICWLTCILVTGITRCGHLSASCPQIHSLIHRLILVRVV